MKIKSLLKNVVLFLSLFSALLLGACNNEPGSDQKVVEIAFPSDTLYLSVGMSKEILYSIVPIEIQESAEIAWTSSRDSIVTVSAEGVATGISEGQAQIIASSGSARASLNVVVSKALKSGIYLSESEFILEVGNTKQLSYTISNPGYEEEDATWESSNPGVASVNNDGLVTAESEGESIITVKVGDLVAHAVVTVLENEPLQLEELVLSVDDIEIYIDETYQVSCYTVPAELQGQVEITWETDNKSIARINNQGILLGMGEGVTKFRARSGSIMVEGNVRVVLPLDQQLEKIELNVSDLTLARNSWFELLYTLTPSYLQGHLDVSWESTDESIAEVDGYGIVFANLCGECDIIATCEGLTAAVHVKVVDDAEYDLTLAKSNVLLPYGETYTMNYYIIPYEYQDQAWVTWKSSNTQVATIDEYGVISSGSVPGTATITASWEGCEDSAEVTVFTMFFGKEKKEMAVGETETIELYVMPDEQYLLSEAIYASSNHNVVTVSSSGVITAKGPGSCYVIAKIATMTISMEVMVCEEYKESLYVDLGLPSGTKWASHNLGASSIYEAGEYYAWGEIFTKSEYTIESSETFEEDFSSLNNDIGGSPMYDAASYWWDTPWRIPSKEQWQELLDECSWSWDENLPGYKVQGKNGNYIYLNAAGRMNAPGLVNTDMAYYWTSTSTEKGIPSWADEDCYACYLQGNRYSLHLVDMGIRSMGLLIRPILPY